MSKLRLVLKYIFWITIFFPTMTYAQSLNVQSSVVNPVLNIVSWIFFIIAAVGGAIIGSMAAWEIPTYLANKGNHRQPILITIISYAIGIACFAAMTVGGPTWLVKALTTVSAPTF
ncbi:conserved hypothetical protein, membrane [Candidatus Magnetomorum sp. HK-1]|nr:conserved hypothetical protein, membrane [Candidatus Magnetomorum sp. HK-1]